MKAPEELRVLVGSRLDDGAVGNHELGARDVVARESELRCQVTDPASQGEARHTGRADDAAGSDQAELLCRRVEVEPRRAALRASSPRLRIDGDAAHAGEIDHQAVVADAVSGGVVATPAHRDLELVSPREVESDCDVPGVDAACDHRRPAIDECVEAASRCVVRRIRGLDDRPGQGSAQLDEIVLEPRRDAGLLERHLRGLGCGAEVCPVRRPPRVATAGRRSVAPRIAAPAAKIAPTRKAAW